MKDVVRSLVFLVGWVLASPLLGDDEPFQEGAQYARLTNPQPTNDPSKVEVLEVFWYGCSHCYQMEPAVENWLKHKPDDVDFVRFPAVPSDRWEWFAKVFYTAEVLGVEEEIHGALFKAIHDKGRALNDTNSMAAFFAEHGVPKDKFISALNSFAVVTKVSRARQLTRRYGITSVPQVIVNGTYRTSGRQAGSGKQIFAVVDYLVEQERSTLQSKVGGNP